MKAFALTLFLITLESNNYENTLSQRTPKTITINLTSSNKRRVVRAITRLNSRGRGIARRALHYLLLCICCVRYTRSSSSRPIVSWTTLKSCTSSSNSPYRWQRLTLSMQIQYLVPDCAQKCQRTLQSKFQRSTSWTRQVKSAGHLNICKYCTV